MIEITNDQVKGFKKYFIIPKDDIAFIVHSGNAEDAMSCFATVMDLDMNTYFRAVTEEEYEEIKVKRNADAAKQNQIDFYIDELEHHFDIPEKDIKDIAERAYECYCKSGSPGYGWAEGLTEYEALEMAVEEYEKKEDDDDEED